MGAVVEQIQQTYDLQVNGYYSQLQLLADSLIQEEERFLELDKNKKFFEAWQKESESTLIFLQENGKAITTDGTKLRVDMPSKLLLELKNGYNIGKLVSLDYEQNKKDGYLVAIKRNQFSNIISVPQIQQTFTWHVNPKFCSISGDCLSIFLEK